MATESFNNNNAQEGTPNNEHATGDSGGSSPTSVTAPEVQHSPQGSTAKHRTVSFNEGRSGNVFNSLDRRDSDRTVPRQQQVQISRKLTEKTPTRQAVSPVAPVQVDNYIDNFRSRAATAPAMSTKRRKDCNPEHKRKEYERREQREIEYANARAGQDESLDEQPEKVQNKYRFAFKKNKNKEIGSKDDISQPKAMPRSIRKKVDGGSTPPRESAAQSAPTDDHEIAKLRNRSASASSNSDLKKKRTRRRRGRKTPGAQEDGQVEQLTMEEAINWIRQDTAVDVYDLEAHARIEKEHGCEVKIVNGTTYFTPASNDRSTNIYGAVQNHQGNGSNDQQWSPSDEAASFDSRSGNSQFVIEGYAKNSKNFYSQSAPINSRGVKQEDENAEHNYKLLGDKLRTIWANDKKTWDELGTDKLANESVLSVIDSEPKRSAVPDRSIWAAGKPAGQQESTVTASEPKPIRPNVWEPRSHEQSSSFGFNSFEREASPIDYFNSPKFHPGMGGLTLDNRQTDEDAFLANYDPSNLNNILYSPLSTRISSG